MSASWRTVGVCFLLLLLQKKVLASTCGLSNFTDTLSEEENGSINTNYTVDITATPETVNFVYQVCEENSLKTACSFIRDKDSMTMVGHDRSQKKGVSCYWEQRNVSRSVMALDIYISQVITRSLSVMVLSLGRGGIAKPKRIIHVNVLYPPNVSSLTVDGHEVDGDYIIEEGKKTDIFCVFDKGNPQISFQLLDKYRYEIKSAGNEEHLSYSLTVWCKHDWPVVSCEGSRSTRNRSVSFLVRCPPQFLEKMKIVNLRSFEELTYHVKAHTAAFTECHLTPVVSDDDSSSNNNNNIRGLSCILSGKPPNLVLSVYLHKQASITQGNWTLNLRNEKGSANTILSIIYGETSSVSVASVPFRRADLTVGAVPLHVRLTFVYQ
ncbi:uncharacterized protein LOC112568208 [Pomacea canaliculata]|uniref:uncharacterized protein LOC112568208 n=1 Tax=Pomacea canaliculata TaxID=400727 RepID=UPI000D73B174|nr:uncharacterized protein LOC112568208 [Pomacea canaliculata]